MKITICGSMAFAKEMIDAQEQLEKAGHVCFVPDGIYEYVENRVKKVGGSEGQKEKSLTT